MADDSSIYMIVQIEGYQHGLKRELVKFDRDGNLGEAIADLIHDTEDSVISRVTAVGPKDSVGITVQLDTPVMVIRELGYNAVNVFLSKRGPTESTDDNNNCTKYNVFNVLMNVNKHYTRLPEKRVERTDKDRMYNHILAVFNDKKIGFTPIQVTKTGKRVVETITNTMWFADGRWEKFGRRGITIPEMFKSTTGYRNYKEQHKKVPEITADDLKRQLDELAEVLMLPWILNKDFKELYQSIKNIVDGFTKYRTFLLKMQDRNLKNHNKDSPVRNLNDSWSLRVLESKVSTGEQKYDFKLLKNALMSLQCYEPLDMCDIEPSEKEERRQWLNNIVLPFPVTLFIYSYGNYLGNLNIVWKIPEKSSDRSSEEEVKVVQSTLGEVSKFGTRRMQRDFIRKYNRFVSPVILRNMYRYLTDFEYSPESEKETQVDLRFCKFLLESEDTDLIYDLRKNNGRLPTEEFDPFWSELDKYLDEMTAVHERRQQDINYLPFAMSVEDLCEIIKRRLPENSKIPSTSWVKLNFSPGNPFNKTACNYTGRFKVKFRVQQRLLRAQHEDSHYGRNQFSLMKAFACKYRNYSVLQSLDDKAIVPVGEPMHAISTGVRPHHGGIVTGSNQNIALDHDFHIAGIVPSVCFIIEIPQSVHDSFYNGTIHVTVKDKVFQASSPIRHSAETLNIIRNYLSEDGIDMSKPILIRYTDGGPDHRVTFGSVKFAALLEFLALDLDMIILGRTAPSMSYSNPAERTMSLLNLALQNVALQRTKMAPEFEMMCKSKTLKSLRALAERNQLLCCAKSIQNQFPNLLQ